MEYDVRIERVGPVATAVVRRRATPPDLPRVVPEACGAAWVAMRAVGVQGAGRNVALYLDDEVNLEAGVELDRPLTGDGDLVSSATPTGPVATAAHFGPYHLLPEAHRAIRRWCAEHGRALAGPNWEVYDHWRGDPAAQRTDVYYLLAE